MIITGSRKKSYFLMAVPLRGGRRGGVKRLPVRKNYFSWDVFLQFVEKIPTAIKLKGPLPPTTKNFKVLLLGIFII